jgi:glucose-6-phosphate-specific signal transduction histidine kinase
MYLHLVAYALGAAAVATGIGWAMARRYGWQRALVVPALAALALVAVLWRAGAMSFHDGIGLMASAVVFAAPSIVGALLGVVLAARRGG